MMKKNNINVPKNVYIKHNKLVVTKKRTKTKADEEHNRRRCLRYNNDNIYRQNELQRMKDVRHRTAEKMEHEVIPKTIRRRNKYFRDYYQLNKNKILQQRKLKRISRKGKTMIKVAEKTIEQNGAIQQSNHQSPRSIHKTLASSDSSIMQIPDLIKKRQGNPAQSTNETLTTNIQNEQETETETNYQIQSIVNSTDESTSDSSTIPKPVKITK